MDTNSANFLFDKTSVYHEALKQRFAMSTIRDDFAISVLTLFEFEYSLFLAPIEKKALIRYVIEMVKLNFPVFQTRANLALHYAELKGNYKRFKNISSSNMRKHNIDIILASTALVENAVVISADRIYDDLAAINPALKHEDWTVKN